MTKKSFIFAGENILDMTGFKFGTSWRTEKLGTCIDTASKFTEDARSFLIHFQIYSLCKVVKKTYSIDKKNMID